MQIQGNFSKNLRYLYIENLLFIIDYHKKCINCCHIKILHNLKSNVNIYIRYFGE